MQGGENLEGGNKASAHVFSWFPGFLLYPKSFHSEDAGRISTVC
jgi:hypothetical protein